MTMLDEPFDSNAAPTGAVVPSPFAQAADALIDAGYVPIPVHPLGKLPADYMGGRWTPMRGWNGYAHRRPEDYQYGTWRNWPDANVGIVLGTPAGNGMVTIAVDIDALDIDVVERLKTSLPASPMAKFGQKGLTLFYRASPLIKTSQFKDAGGTMLAEILTGNAVRQTVMPPSVHPITNRPYVLVGQIVPASELPVLDEDAMSRFLDTLAAVGWVSGNMRPSVDFAARDVPIAQNDDDPNIWRETNDVALQRLHLWVGELGLPKLRRHPNGSWEAVPVWRSSNAGRPTEARKPNLKFHRDGIKDMGTDVGYTPLDAVGAAFSWDFDTCFRWLRAKIGLADEDGYVPTPRVLVESEDGELSDAQTGELIPHEAAAQREFPDELTHVPGLLGAMVEHIVDTSHRPSRTLALASALVCLGTIIGRRDATPKCGGTAVYAIAIAPTGAGKQHPQDAGEAMLRAAIGYRELGEDLVGPSDLMSQSALINAIEAQPLQAAFLDEFGDFVEKLNSPKGSSHEVSIKKVLLSTWGVNFKLWKSVAWASIGTKKIESPSFSFFGASTPRKFFGALQGNDRENGLLNRCLLFPTYRKSAMTEPAYDYREVPPDLAESLAAAFRVRRSENPLSALGPADMHVTPWTDAAKSAFNAFVVEIDGMADMDFHVRAAENALRLATIRAVGRDTEFPTVEVTDIEWGIAVSRWSADAMAEAAGKFVSDTETGRWRAKVIGELERSGPLRTRDMMRRIHLPKRELDAVIADLVVMEMVEVSTICGRGGTSKIINLATQSQSRARAR